MLFFSYPPCLFSALREIGEEEVACDCEWERDYSVDDEEPAPYFTCQLLVHFR